MGLLKLPKFAVFAVLLISAMVSTFGGAQTVIKEVVGKSDESCSNEICFPKEGIECCEGYTCLLPLIYPDQPGTCSRNWPVHCNKRAEVGEAETVIKKEVMMVEEDEHCLPRGAFCTMVQGTPPCCGRLVCRPVIPGTLVIHGTCQRRRPWA